MTNLDAFGQAPALEQDAIRAISVEDYTTFERRVIQLKALYQNDAKLVPTEATYKSLALYLLYLLASDRIADFHTLVESLSTHEQANQYVRYPVQLERYIMEGNYAKVLAERRDSVFDSLFQKLQIVVHSKQQETRAESASTAGMQAGSGLTVIDQAAALGVLSNMVGYATDLERIATGITDRQEVSRLRKKLSAMGCEWDLMWNVDKLRKEVISAIRSGKKVAIPSEFKSRVLRYVVYHVHVDRLECYDRSLQVGQFKLRLTLSCPGTQRPSIAWESDRAFLGSSCLKAEEGFFRLTVPVNLKASPDQLSAWRVEFEVLHKYPAAPIYSVVGRSWIDPPTLAQAEAIDVFSTFNRDNVIVRVNFTKTAHSCVGINLFKTVSLCVIFLARVGRLLALNRKREIVELEREVRVLNARSQTFYQAEHLALMTKTIETMNKYMESGSKPEDWLRAMQKAGVFGEEPERRIDAQISLLKAQIEGLRSDVMRSVIERPPPIVQIVSPEPRSPEIPDEPQAKPAGGLLGWFTGPGPVDVPPFPAELLSPKKEPPPSEAPSSLPPAAPAALGAPSGLSVKERMAAKPAVEARQKIIPRRATQAEPILTEPPNVNEEDQIEEEVEDAKEEEEPVEDMAAAVSNTVSSWWGAMTSAVAPEVTTARVNPAPLVAAVTKTPPPPPVVESVTKTPPVEVQAKKGASVVKKAVPAKKAGPPVKKTVVVPKQKVDPMKAKIEMIMKIKAIEAKRKAEIAVTEKAIVELAKSLPPIDKMKFIGLPGPPPFAPKAKASAAAQDTALPAALAPPPVAGNDEQLELIDEEDEQEAN